MPHAFPSIGQTARLGQEIVPSRQVIDLQHKLAALGYHPILANDPEGFLTPALQDLIGLYQQNSGLPQTRTFDNPTVQRINADLAARFAAAAPSPPLATEGIPTALNVAFTLAQRTVPGAAPIIQQQILNVQRGLAVDPAALIPARDALRTSPDPTAASAAAQLDAILASVNAVQTGPNAPGRFTAAPGSPDTAATGAPARSVLAKIGIGVLLTSPFWGTVLWTHHQKT